MEIINALGRRKAAVARVYVKQGNGTVTVNGKDFKTYFPVPHIQTAILAALQTVSVETLYDVTVNVKGGGVKGQAEAVRLGIARALCEINIEFRPALKALGYLTRDAREVERKKFGLRKARRATQFSKR
jgi:small subunit ribosomal protein S9